MAVSASRMSSSGRWLPRDSVTATPMLVEIRMLSDPMVNGDSMASISRAAYRSPAPRLGSSGQMATNSSPP
jgi:hypothetical protein